MENHRKRLVPPKLRASEGGPPAAHDAEPFDGAEDDFLPVPDDPEACPEPGRGDAGDEPIRDVPPPPLHPPECPGFGVGGIDADSGTSGFYYLSGAPVPPTHPDHGPMDLLPRKPDGGFATYYYCAKAELQEWGIDHPPPLRRRHDGFTPEKIAIFIRTLRATGSVTDAARAAGITRKTAYDLYGREDAGYFRAAWDEAMRGPANVVLAATAYDRAINGVEEAVWYKGEFRGWRVRHDNRLLMWLLRVRDPLNFAPLDDLAGWLRHRDVEAHLPTEPMIDRLEAAERAWEKRAPGSEAGPAFPDPEAHRRAVLEESTDSEENPALEDRAGRAGEAAPPALEDGRAAGEAGRGDAEPAP